MRIFSHWTRVAKEVLVGREFRRLHAYGGSDQSLAAAARDAENRLARVVTRIQAGRKQDPDYEADIREEITHRIDANNIVTRNRYGAEVLNSANVVFVDIDDPRLSWKEVFFGREKDPAKRKQRIVEAVRQRTETPELRSLGIRVYETHKGIRLLVTGQAFPPQAKSTRKFLRSFDADHLYVLLCAKQGCFRARLTPKPYRIKQRSHRVVYPRLHGPAERDFQDWLSEYEVKRTAYATCRHLLTLGMAERNAVIDYHDRVTGAFSNLKLA